MRDDHKFKNLTYLTSTGGDPGHFWGSLDGSISVILHPSFVAKTLHLAEIRLTMCLPDSFNIFLSQ